MKAVEGTSRSYYEVVMPKSMLGKKVSVKVVGYIQKENQEWSWSLKLNPNFLDFILNVSTNSIINWFF